jgi:ABC-type Mn2+/Zn2+ transport system permease subunit
VGTDLLLGSVVGTVIDGVVDGVVDPLGLRFFVYGLLASILAVGGGAVLGPVSVLRQEPYMAQGVGQSMVAGAAVGSMLSIPVPVAAFLAAVVAAGIMFVINKTRFATPSGSVAIVSSVMLSIGIAVISADRERGVNVSNILFGNILGVRAVDLVLLGVVVVLAIGFMLRNGRSALLAACNPQVAAVHGVQVARLEAVRLVVMALVVAGSVQVVGVSLVVVALVIPYSVVAPFTRSLRGLLLGSLGVGSGIGVVGMYFSYHADLPSGPAIVLVAGMVYVGAKILDRGRTYRAVGS